MGFVRVVNMIPATLSGETNQDSEPNLAVNPERPTDMVATAFTPAPGGAAFAPIYVSTDGGSTWALRNVVPGGGMTADITVGFATTGGTLYAGILRQGTTRMQILRTATFAGLAPMTVLVDRGVEDQPWVVAGSVVVNGRSVDRVYVGSKDSQPRPAISGVAAVDLSLDAAAAPAPANFRETALGLRRGRFSLPPTRVAIHPDGTVYAAFLHVTQQVGNPAGADYTFDVVVRRDDRWGDAADPFAALKEPGEVTPGVRAGSGFTRFADILGQERVGADLAIAVHPNNSAVVYVAFCDRPGGAAGTGWRLQVIRSVDRGASWTGVHDVGPVAKNPALAINTEGRVGLAYQQLTNARWITRLELTQDAWATPPEAFVLHQAPANVPARTFLPYLGDYIRLLAVGTDLYGVFSGNNAPDLANFPNGVRYQRNANFTTRTLLNVDGVTPVAVSVDPFFFHWSRVKPRETKPGLTKAEIDTPPKTIKSERKEVVEHKPGLTKAELDVPPKSIVSERKLVSEHPPGGVTGLTDAGAAADPLADLLLRIDRRLTALEEGAAEGRAFIRPAERPDVGPAPDDAGA